MNFQEILKKYNNPSNFFNRDLSWIEFNRRVLEEAFNPELPLLDKIKFISIFFSNLDEFYMIRVAGIKDQIAAAITEPTIDGLTPREELSKIEKEVKPLVDSAIELWNNKIISGLAENGIHIIGFDDLTTEEKEKLNNYFKKEIYPILTPLAFDPGRPFPYISNLSLSLAVRIRKSNGKERFARVKVPSSLPRLLRIETIVDPNFVDCAGDNYTARFIWIGEILQRNLETLFPGMTILESHRFRITRDTDMELQEDEADDLLEMIEENIKQRRFGSVVRLEVDKTMPDFMIDILNDNLQITREETHILDGPLGLSSAMSLYSLPLPNLKERPFYPYNFNFFENENIFSLISKKDVLLHHPFHSFNPVLDFIKTASQDPDVLAIKQTLYRVGQNSPIVEALIEAAEMKKQVAVLVELKARFDEENNIKWARELEKVGVHVVYGLVGLKTHAKMTLVVRKEHDGVKRYVHLGTGNYNPETAKLYTDLSLFTSNHDISADVSEVFNYLTGYSEQEKYKKLLVAPINMNDKFLKLIQREIINIKSSKKARLIFKLNSLVDPVVIAALYEASNAGVQIDLIVRGVCCLIPGKPNLSENINVISVVGRFLEHSRIYYFYNNGEEEVYLSSADLMPRNLYRRVEVSFPLLDQALKSSLIDIMTNVYLKDNIKAKRLNSEGNYDKIEASKNAKRICAQDWLMKNASIISTIDIKKRGGK